MKAVRVPCGERPWLGPCLGLCWNRLGTDGPQVWHTVEHSHPSPHWRTPPRVGG